MRFARFARGQQKFRGFNFHKWLLTHEKRENKSLAKITNHTVCDNYKVGKTLGTNLIKIVSVSVYVDAL